MTVAEIKEFVDKCIHDTKSAPLEIPKNEVLMILNFIKNDLDELEPKAKWKVYKKRKGEIKIGADIQCSNCGSISDMLTMYG